LPHDYKPAQKKRLVSLYKPGITAPSLLSCYGMTFKVGKGNGQTTQKEQPKKKFFETEPL
jgi:hypothetical protein